MSPELDIYGNIGAIRDTLETLLKRGKPASVADLQALMASVEAKSQPTINLQPAAIAKQLAPQLLPLLPTPDNLAAAGKQAAGLIEASINSSTQQSINQITTVVQEGVRQLTAAAAVLTKAGEAMPSSVPVDFLQGWRWPTALALTPLSVALLFLWIGGAFSGVSQVKYDQLQQEKQVLSQANQKLLTQGRFYYDQVQQYRKKFPKAASYFPNYVAPATSTVTAE